MLVLLLVASASGYEARISAQVCKFRASMGPGHEFGSYTQRPGLFHFAGNSSPEAAKSRSLQNGSAAIGWRSKIGPKRVKNRPKKVGPSLLCSLNHWPTRAPSGQAFFVSPKGKKVTKTAITKISARILSLGGGGVGPAACSVLSFCGCVGVVFVVCLMCLCFVFVLWGCCHFFIIFCKIFNIFTFCLFC